MILNLILRLVVLTFGIILAAYLLPGIKVEGYGPAIKAAIVLGLMNLTIKPALYILTLPINLLTLGFFSFILNGIILWLVGYAVTGFEVTGFFTAIFGALVISIMGILLDRFI
ncbi:MAG: phage holin family protein [Deltaproteobacteria bacterium]|nr:phage holin family protein [Deltaproteobacteria bacterium]